LGPLRSPSSASRTPTPSGQKQRSSDESTGLLARLAREADGAVRLANRVTPFAGRPRSNRICVASGATEVSGFGAAAQPIVGEPDSYALRAEAAII
jgi:hypothetical protein